jgi:hypothetical protein
MVALELLVFGLVSALCAFWRLAFVYWLALAGVMVAFSQERAP